MAKGKKAKAFKLFNEGKDASSPEVKALGLKGGTRYTYHDEWKKSKAEGGEPEAEGGEPEAEVTITPHGEVIGGYDETKAKTQEEHKEIEEKKEPEVKLEIEKVEEGKETEAKLEVEKERPPREWSEVSVPEEIIGFGIRIGVYLSLKSLALYQIASTTSKVKDNSGLSLGEFLDECVEDFFVGRGSDLGLVKLEK